MKSKKSVFLTLIVGCCLCLSSCFQLIEEISVKKDGSGTVVLTANLSQSKSKIASVMLLDSINGYKVPSKQDIRKELLEAANTLKKIEGISEVSHTVDFDKYIATIRFSFTEVGNLNNITKLLFEELKVNSINNSSYAYHKNNKTFSRQYTHEPQARAAYDKLKAADREIFQNATYTSIYRFDDAVVQQSNGKAKVSASKKAVLLQSPVLDLINGQANISNQIQLSR